MRIYISQASKRHYWKEEDSRQSGERNKGDTTHVPLQSRAELGLTAGAQDQVSKFYRRYPTWGKKEERYDDSRR